jgi:transcriptional regulator GlxA family with amidase domain
MICLKGKLTVLFLVMNLCMLKTFAQQKNIMNEIAFVCGPCGCADDGKYFDKAGLCPSCGMELYAAFKRGADTSSQNPTNTHSQHTRTQKKVAILIYQGAEIIDFAGPWEVFAQARMNVYTVASKDTIINAMGMRILPDYTFTNAPKPDILLVPGGSGEYGNKETIDWIKKTAAESETVFSVCDGAFFLGNAGLLDGHEATTFFSLIPALQRLTPNAKVVSHKRYVDNGKIITSAGLSSGIDATFHVVSKYLGLGRTQEIATHLEYNWDPQAKYVRGLLADKHLRGARGVFSQFATQTLLYAGDQSKWEIRLSVDTKMEARQLARLIEFQLSEAQKWTKVSTRGNNSKWTFTADNKKWSGSASVEAVSKSFGEKIVKLMVSENN